jgi:hypothetical protein
MLSTAAGFTASRLRVGAGQPPSGDGDNQSSCTDVGRYLLSRTERVVGRLFLLTPRYGVHRVVDGARSGAVNVLEARRARKVPGNANQGPADRP